MLEWSKKSKVFVILFIIFGTMCMAIGVKFIFEPMQMVTGGFSGLAIVVKQWSENLGFRPIPVWLTVFTLNVPLFIIAFFKKGKKFLIKTLFANICFTAWLYFIPVMQLLAKDYLMASICGGVITGVGLGFVFSTSTSTGGTDLLGTILQTTFRRFSVAQLLFIVDSIIVLIGAFLFGLNNALYAVIAVFISTKVMDGILEGLKFAKMVYVISDHSNEIAKGILEDIDRGVTSISVRGMYSNNQKNMLFCVVSRKEVVKLTDLVASMDPKAFMIVSDVREVLGEGFIEYGHK